MKRVLLGLAWAWACAGAALAGTLEVTVLDKAGKPVPDAVVVAVPAAAGGTPPPLPPSAAITQEKMQFSPVVTLVGAGTRVVFSNLDRWDHHVRGVPGSLTTAAAGNAAGGFELRLDGQKPGKPPSSAELRVEQAGPVLLSCHLHGSMRGYLFVAQSPWTLKTDEAGRAVFTGLPDGAAEVRVWHAEQLIDLPATSVTTGASPVQASVQLQVVPRRRRV